MGSENGFILTPETIRTGGSQEYLGATIAGGFDSNADGLIEFVYSTRNATRGTTYGIDMMTVSKQDFDTSQFNFEGEISGLELATSNRGETAMMFSLNNSSLHSLVHLEHVDDGSIGGSWVTEILSTSSSTYEFQFDVTHAGQPVLVTLEDSVGFVHSSTTSWTALHQDIRTYQDFGTYPASTIDSNGDLHIVYSHNSIEKLYYSTEDPGSSGGWDSTEIQSNSNLTSQPTIWFEGSDLHVLYRDANLDKIEHMTKTGTTWTTETELDFGRAVGIEHSAVQLSNGTTMVATTVNNSGVYELQVLDIDHDFSTSLTTLSDGATELSMCMDSNDTIVLLSLDSSGNLVTHERNASTEMWANVSMQQLGNLNGPSDLACTQHGSSLIFAVQASGNALHERNSTGIWSSFGEHPILSEGGAWNVVSNGPGLLLMTTTPGSDTLRINTMHLDGPIEDRTSWSSHEMKNVYTNANFSANVDSNGTVVFGYLDSQDLDVEMVRLYSDSDRDLVFDRIDAMPHVGEQWNDQDSDGFGDNPTGPLSDDCPSDSGISFYYIQGCDDYDHDGFGDDIDSCDITRGRSIFDRYGCVDTDEDGWSDTEGTWPFGDRFKLNWKQAKDSDGDGIGDNYGVDCCDAIFGSGGVIEYSLGDKFPYNPRQYKDHDNDGYGDNDSDKLTEITVHGIMERPIEIETVVWTLMETVQATLQTLVVSIGVFYKVQTSGQTILLSGLIQMGTDTATMDQLMRRILIRSRTTTLLLKTTTPMAIRTDGQTSGMRQIGPVTMTVMASLTRRIIVGTAISRTRLICLVAIRMFRYETNRVTTLWLTTEIWFLMDARLHMEHPRILLLAVQIVMRMDGRIQEMISQPTPPSTLILTETDMEIIHQATIRINVLSRPVLKAELVEMVVPLSTRTTRMEMVCLMTSMHARILRFLKRLMQPGVQTANSMMMMMELRISMIFVPPQKQMQM